MAIVPIYLIPTIYYRLPNIQQPMHQTKEDLQSKTGKYQTPKQFAWWQKGVVYEIYIRSFKDSNGDGIGDLRGIIEKLDYLDWLGIEAVWITPFYPSPMKDFGYDVSDYTGIEPMFGTMNDFEELIREAHRRDMKVIMDVVPNHTSDQHPWFLESKSSHNNPKSDWYLWHDPAPDGGPPNNWLSVLGGTGWEWVEERGQYYHHAFLIEQPDLNLRNPEVMDAILDAFRFWLDKGVDGFRVDVMWHLIKDEQWRDNPANPDYQSGMPTYDQFSPVYSTDQPEIHDVVAQFRQLLDKYGDKVLIGEMYLPVDKVVKYYGANNQGAHLPGNFQLLLIDWDARKIALEIDKYEAILPTDAWPNWVFSNHDRPRVATRYGKEQARVAAMLLLTLRGTPTLYYGDELGMQNVPIPEEEVKDPQGLLMPGLGLSRDPQRTPMQWDASDNAGFTTENPWMRLSEQYAEENVSTQQQDPASMLSLYRQLLQLRRAEPALHTGDYTPVPAHDPIIAYIRSAGETRLIVVLNFGNEPAAFTPERMELKGTIILQTRNGQKGEKINGSIQLHGNEGVIIRLD